MGLVSWTRDKIRNVYEVAQEKWGEPAIDESKEDIIDMEIYKETEKRLGELMVDSSRLIHANSVLQETLIHQTLSEFQKRRTKDERVVPQK